MPDKSQTETDDIWDGVAGGADLPADRRMDPATLRSLQVAAFRTAEKKGFHDNWTGSRYDALALLCLVGTEVSEAAQEVKRHWDDDAGPDTHPRVRYAQSQELKDKIGAELADILIRVFDFAGLCGIDLQDATMAKMATNNQRPHMYGTPNAAINAVGAMVKGEGE